MHKSEGRHCFFIKIRSVHAPTQLLLSAFLLRIRPKKLRGGHEVERQKVESLINYLRPVLQHPILSEGQALPEVEITNLVQNENGFEGFGALY